MKKLLTVWVALMLAMASFTMAAAEDVTVMENTTLDVALNARPQSDEPVHLTVGNTTKVNGSFFTTFFGNNTSDIDVRTMLHGYSPVVWDNQLEFVPDPMVVEDLTKTPGKNSVIYTVTLQRDLLYCDGETPIKAEDYVFAWLLGASRELTAIGANAPQVNVAGFEEYYAGESNVFSGIRLLDEYQFSIEVKGEFDPYFYDFSQISLNPYPISVLAPGCKVKDDGEGAYIANADEEQAEPVFTAELLYKTILDPETGYRSYPRLTCGPYRLVDYDPEAGVVDFEINPYYKGNYEGVKPVIDTITLVPVETDTMIEQLESGEVDLLNKCVDNTVIMDGIALTGAGGFVSLNYPRLGYGFCALSCEQGPQQFMNVRQALAYSFDKDAFVNEFLGGFGMPVYGYYGIGQWMVGAVTGSIRPMEMTPEEEAVWDSFSFDRLNPYPYDLEKARQLLIDDGWTLNSDGEAFDETKDTLRYKQVDGELMPLSLRFAKCIGNDAADMVVAMYNESLPQIGAELIVEDVTFNALLEDYYRTDGKRAYDMNFMATNFVSTFDPYLVFSGDENFQGAVNTSGLYDEELVKLAWEMRCTPPGALVTFEERWLKMQERFNEVLPTLPIYSNIYFDFHTDWLQNYYANAEYSWPVAILYSYYAQPEEDQGLPGVEEMEEEEEEWEEGGMTVFE